MRRTSTLVISSLALPLLTAAKPVIDNEGHAFLSAQLFGGHAAGKTEQLRVRAIQWGSADRAGSNELQMDDTAGGSRTVSGEVFYKPPASTTSAKERRAGMSDLKAETDKGRVDSAVETQRKELVAESRMGDQAGGHGMPGASDKVTVGGARTESGQATGKRVHKPFRARMYYDQAQPRGSLTVKGSFPGCTVGARYGGMQFASGGKTYRLQDVTVADCPASAAPAETITFVYGTLEMR